MKLFIREDIIIPKEYRPIVESVFVELLKSDDVVNELSTYIPNFDPEVNYEDYKDEPIVKDIKADIYNSIKSLKSDIEALPKVRIADFTISKHMGLSNYVHIRFHKPVEAPDSWRHDFKHLYDMNLKVSDHFNFNRPSVTHTLRILNKTLSQINSDIMDIVKNQIDLINQAEAEIPNYQ